MTALTKMFCSLVLVIGYAQATLSQKGLHGRDTGADFVDPASVGGNMYFRFANSPTTKPEPINVIISAASSFDEHGVGNDTQIFLRNKGLSQYLTALNFSDECAGLHLSTPAYANISSSTPELLDFLYRENFGNYPDGTCLESLNGGHHFRGWRQSLSGAWFLAASKEMNLTLHHDLVPDGYDIGRDEVVARALTGGKDPLGCVWPPASVSNLSTLVALDAGGTSGAYNHDIGIDGVVKLITVGAPACPPSSSTVVSGPSASVGSMIPRGTGLSSTQSAISASPSAPSVVIATAGNSVSKLSSALLPSGVIIGIVSVYLTLA